MPATSASTRVRGVASLLAILASAGGARAATVTTVASFTATTGANPGSTLVADAFGNLYGTALNGGSGDRGTIFIVRRRTRR